MKIMRFNLITEIKRKEKEEHNKIFKCRFLVKLHVTYVLLCVSGIFMHSDRDTKSKPTRRQQNNSLVQNESSIQRDKVRQRCVSACPHRNKILFVDTTAQYCDGTNHRVGRAIKT